MNKFIAPAILLVFGSCDSFAAGNSGHLIAFVIIGVLLVGVGFLEEQRQEKFLLLAAELRRQGLARFVILRYLLPYSAVFVSISLCAGFTADSIVRMAPLVFAFSAACAYSSWRCVAKASA